MSMSWSRLANLLPQQGGVRFFDLPVDQRPDPEEACLRSEQRRMLNQAFKHLNQTQQRALSLDFRSIRTGLIQVRSGLPQRL